MATDALIIDAVRSPIGRRNGSLAATRGDERSHAADVPALLSDLGHAAHLNVLDLGRIEVVPRHEPVEHLTGELVPPNRRESAVPPPDGRADGIDDQRLRLHLA